MGQKVHPLGFRVGITKKHQSQWFARFNKNKYSQSVLEDHMLRQTLTNLFKANLKKTVSSEGANKNDNQQDAMFTSKITQIKIERGLIPYEIGIQIYAEKSCCESLKSAIDNLKVNQELVCKLQKARRYLLNLRSKLNYVPETSTGSTGASELKVTKSTNTSFTTNFKGFKPRLTKQEQRRQRLIKKRLKKRQNIKSRYRQLISKGLFIKKAGTKIVQKLSLKKSARDKGSFSGQRGLRSTWAKKTSGTKNFGKVTGQSLIRKTRGTSLAIGKFGSQKSNMLKKKFVSIFIKKINKKFLKHLKESIHSNLKNEKLLVSPRPLGFNKKWSLNRLNLLKKQPVAKLQRLVRILEQKSLVKLESLRKEYIAFGSISTVQSYSYYQIVNFLKHLKDLVNKVKREQKLQLILNKVYTAKPNSSTSSFKDETGSNLLNLKDTRKKSLMETVLYKKLNNIDDECRKIKFIEYLKQIVQKHRTNNIFLYLATISDARKDLQKLQKFTKRHANFLFGLNLGADESKIQDRVSKVLEKTANKSDFDKTLQDVFMEQIEKQRTMYQENAQLIPKITLKFYSVNAKSLESKASIISDTVVDALEKRKAFRKVIKDAKEQLMKTSGVKGVKIQLSGRLNGAEIARTEWVRAGRVPLQTLRANLDFSYKTANTIYGIIGVKVWIFKGYTKFIN